MEEILSLLKDREKTLKLIKLGIKLIRKEDLEKAIKNKICVDNILFNHFSPYLESPLKPIIKTIFRLYWDIVEFFLLNPKNLRDLIIECKPELKELLESKEGIEWLNKNCKEGYKKTYAYCWSE